MLTSGRPRWPLAIAAVALAAVAVSLTAPGSAHADGTICPDGQGCVAVFVNNSTTPQLIAASAIGSGGTSENVTLRPPGGTCNDGSAVVDDGTTLQDLLADDVTGIDPDTVDHVTVTRADGTQIEIPRPYVEQGAAPDFYEDQLPIFGADGPGRVQFVRSLYADPDPCPADGDPPADADANGQDQVNFQTEIDVHVNDGAYLPVTVSASTTEPKPSTPDTLTASVATNSDVVYRYEWNFGDGHHKTTQAPQVAHTFAEGVEGTTYRVTVTVIGSDNSNGFGDLEIDAPTSPSPSPTPTCSTSCGPGSIPTTSPSASPSGGSTSPSSTSPSPTTGFSLPKDIGGGHRAGLLHAHLPKIPGLSQLKGLVLGRHGIPPEVARVLAQPPEPTQAKTISGELLSGAESAVAATANGAEPAATVRSVSPVSPRERWAWVVFGVLLAALMVFGGALRETRRLRDSRAVGRSTQPDATTPRPDG